MLFDIEKMTDFESKDVETARDGCQLQIDEDTKIGGTVLPEATGMGVKSEAMQVVEITAVTLDSRFKKLVKSRGSSSEGVLSE
jgi:hypothetical protein